MSHAIFSSNSNAIQKILPCFPGYAMGGIIPTFELERPYLEQTKSDLESGIIKIKQQMDKIKNDSGVQQQLRLLNQQAKQFEENLKRTEKRIKECQGDEEGLSSFEIMLPIDYSRSGIEYRDTADESESMHFIVLKRQSAEQQLSKFTEHLTQMRYLPSVVDLVDQVSRMILDQYQDQEVCLLGSFITLSRVRVIDPIVIRKHAVLSDQLIQTKTASKFSVISEAVLGGAFIGFGTNISNNTLSESSSSQEIKKVVSQMHTFSFISQGAIPTTDNFSLWDTYNNWKKKLITDQHCGFPVAFKVRKLTDILEENGLKEENRS
ncbi:hypothetical protein [Rhabdochlamydiaceae symbiont of Dictyostelium giganteum]|uniref:hypothetical protein n=1 Tax=Rhabdochlamydiaceae symbiont of Dictyostelium giganteum TaxID=3342349 RepID=UPI00384CDED6